MQCNNVRKDNLVSQVLFRLNPAIEKAEQVWYIIERTDAYTPVIMFTEEPAGSIVHAC